MPRGRTRYGRRRGAGQRRRDTPGGPPVPDFDAPGGGADVGGLPSREEMGEWKRADTERRRGQAWQRFREGEAQAWKRQPGGGEGRGRAFRAGEEMAGRAAAPAPTATPGVPVPRPEPSRSQAPGQPQVPVPWGTPTPGQRAPQFAPPVPRFFAPPGAPRWGQYIQQPRTVPGPQDWLPYQRNWYDDGGRYNVPGTWRSDAWRIVPEQGWEFGWPEPPPVELEELPWETPYDEGRFRYGA